MAQSVSQRTAVIKRLTALKERNSWFVLPNPADTIHVALPQKHSSFDSLDAKLEYCFRTVRDNFKKYNTKAKHKLISYVIAPEAEQSTINRYFKNDEELKQLMKYLNMALNDFARNLERFMRNVKNTDYQVVITPKDSNSANLSIAVKNSKGRQAGPFLHTAVCQDNSDGYSRLNVSIGYVSKNRKKIITHFFSYDTDYKVDNLVEQRGNKKYLKTESQVMHDRFSKINVDKLHKSLKFKRGR